MNNNRLIRILLIIGLVTGVTLAVVYRDRFDAEALEAWILGSGPLAPLIFIFIYAAAAVLVLPGSVLTLAGGALFGPVLGTLYNLAGATLGATLAFLIARHLASDWVAEKAGGRVRQLINGVEGEGWRFVAFVRLVPLFPFNLLNYALGLTRIRILHYVVASFFFMLPVTFAYTYLGYAGREAIAGGEGLVRKAALALALIAVVAFLPRLVGTLRRGPTMDIPAFRDRIDSDDDLLVLDVRTAEDFTGEQGHIEGAVNIPVEDLQERMGELCDYLERTVAIVCRTDGRSAKAALLLTEEGFADVHIVRRGMTGWLAAGLPVAREDAASLLP
ncbi:MAG: VTT domain-containing protein [Pseudomonadota bacterium]|nr:VTT domain-containing protein [Pseudomonadota bacterium]